MDDPSDEDLMLRAMSGDHEAISRLVDHYHAPLYRYLYRLLDGNRPAAEDLLQDTFTRLLAPRTYRPGRPVKPWLYTIATNLVRDHARRLAHHRGDQALDSMDLPATADDPADRAQQSEQERIVRAAIRGLSAEQRTAIVLRFYQGLSLAEIAQALDVPIGTVKSRLSIGTRRLRDRIGPLLAEMDA